MTLATFIIGVLFIVIHLLTNHIIPTSQVGRLRWLSFSGGIAVSYVFVYVLPALHEEQQQLGEPAEELAMESELYFFGLIGVLLFYGIQNAADFSKRKYADREGEDPFFWVQIGFFTLYNMLIAFVVISAAVEGLQAVFYSAAIGLHFVAVAHDLWSEDKERYNRVGRYILAGGIVLGWLAGMFVTLSPMLLSMIFAFISGAMILNVLKIELPAENNAHFPTFAIGAVSYTVLTMSLKFFFEW